MDFRRFLWISLCFVALSLGATQGVRAQSNAAEESPPNVVFLLVDDLGWADLPSYGNDVVDTPNIDRLVNQGMRFTNAYAASTVCSPTRASLLTGKAPARLRLTDWIVFGKDYLRPWASQTEPDWKIWLEHDELTLAEIFSANGYRTVHIGKWHLGEESHYPESQGFDVNVGGIDYGFPPGGYHLPNELDLPGAEEGDYLTDHLTTRAIEYIRATEDRPLFLNLWYYTVHRPIEGESDLVDYYASRIKPGSHHANPEYAAMVHSLDQSVGRIMDALQQTGQADNTILIFASDNGGLTHDDGRFLGITDNHPLRRGKGSAYEGGHRVPMIVRWPGVTPDGAVSDEPVITTDIFPTLARSLDLKAGTAEDPNTDGMNLRPVLENPEARLNREALFWHYPHYHPGGDGPYSAVRAGRWKLIERLDDGALELYDLAADIGLTHDVAADRPDVARRLKEMLETWRYSVDAQMPVPNPEHDPSRAERVVWQ